MKILKKLLGGDTKIHVDEIADSAGRLLGESVIVESGSNSNGRYIKYADGTLECYQTINLGKTIYGAGSFGNPYRTETKNWTFPHQFIDTNITLSTTGRISSEDAMQRACICSGNQLSATRLDQVQIATLSTATTTSDAFAHLKAIGRWKV